MNHLQPKNIFFVKYKSLMNPTSQPRYRGLINEGSTCYLNSLIQTLFMTPEFRTNVYSYVYNSKKIESKHSIPYQLQKLFVQLQTSERPVTTKGLLKSFQWTEADAFEQHDVQEFCRKLFEAIEIANKKAQWISELFQGQMISFVQCSKHLSQKQEAFMDISLPIHNPYTKQQFQSLEECLKEYLKPQKLQDKFHCEDCGQKVQVHKGLKVGKLPPLLTIQLNRFQLNYETWQREKLNTFLYFPEILHMHKFMKDHKDIEIAELPSDLKSKIKVTEKQQSARTANIYGDAPPKPTDTVPKIKHKRKASDEIQSNKAKVFFYEEQTKRQKQQKNLSAEQQMARNKQILADLKSEKSQIDSKVKKAEKISEQKQVEKQLLTATVQNSLQDDFLFGTGFGLLPNQPIQWNSGSVSNQPTFPKTQTIFEHQEQLYDPKKQYPSGTYMLYAVLVHSGGAYGGHYYAYISNGQEWFKFDDSTVKKVNRNEIRKYGDFGKNSHGANAYLLFYRDVETMRKEFVSADQVKIPQELMEKVKNDKEPVSSQPQAQSRADKRYQQITQGVMLKILYLPHSIDPNEPLPEPISLFIQNRHQQTISTLKLRLLSLFPELQQAGPQNWRLRRYNKLEQSLHEVYSQDFNNETLESLGFRETVYVAIETKAKTDVFEEYDPKQIVVKVNVWRPNITILTEKYLKPIKITISQQAPFTQLRKKITLKTSIPNPLILKRNFSQSNPIHIYQNSSTQKLIDLRFFNGINLYIQQQPVIQQNLLQKNLKWVQQFQSEKYRCLIKYNDPTESQLQRNHQLYFDTRKTLKQLKQQLSELIKLPVGEFRIKKSRQAVSELTQYNKKLYDLKFIANEFLYLEKGKSSCGSIIMKAGKVEIVEGRIQFTIGQQVIVELEETTTAVSDLLDKLSLQINTSKNLLRLRQYKAYQFGQIFRPSEAIQRIKEKSLIYEVLNDPQQASQKGVQLYVRRWDVMTLQLSQLRQLFIDPQATCEQFAYIVEEEFGISPKKLLLWKSLSNYIQKETLLDCEWIEVTYIRRKVKEEPLYISCDGQILIIKQADQEYHPKVIHTVGNSSTKERGKQAQLKITVMAENSDEQEEMLKQALNASLQPESSQETNPN